MSATTGEVRLNHITLRGTAEAIAAARGPVKTALEQSHWPTTGSDELILIRHISTSGNAREIAARAADQARRLADNAVDGWSGAAAGAPAVRFRNHASLIACLIRDLLHNTTHGRWYWRRWQKLLQHSTEEALLILLQESPLELPAIVARLNSSNLQRPFWQRLGSSGAERLLAVVAQAAGWSTTLQSARHLTATNSRTPVTTAPLATAAIDLTFLGTTATDPRPLLAALLTLWQQAPARLGHPDGAQQLLQLSQTIAAGRSPEMTVVINAAQADAATPESNNPAREAASHTAPESRQQNSAAPDTHMDKTAPAAPNGSGHPRQQNRTSKITGHTNEPEEEQITADITTCSSDIFIYDFITNQGGLLFLLNFLNLPPVRAQLPADLPGAGWRWLHDLASALGIPPAGPLLEFMAHEAGLESATALTQQPRLDAITPLLRLGANRYGEALWQGRTWQLPARLIASASHIDLHLRLNDAHPGVRRAGLDLNPGWLPWLGRVVTFHYGSGQEPGR